MSQRGRIVLAVIGLLLLCLSALALMYALSPVDKLREQFRPAPTLFVPPLSHRFDFSDWGTPVTLSDGRWRG